MRIGQFRQARERVVDVAHQRGTPVLLMQLSGQGENLLAAHVEARPGSEHERPDVLHVENVACVAAVEGTDQNEVGVGAQEIFAGRAIDGIVAGAICEIGDCAITRQRAERGDLRIVGECHQQLVGTEIRGSHTLRCLSPGGDGCQRG